MHDVTADADYLELIVRNDDNTPWDFVTDLLEAVLDQSPTDALAVAHVCSQRGHAVCGTFPRAVAEAMLQAAQQRIDAAGHSLRMTLSDGDDVGKGACKLCGEIGQSRIRVAGRKILICDNCMLAASRHIGGVARAKSFTRAHDALTWHFAGVRPDQLVASSRLFPGEMRADIQIAVERLFSPTLIRFFAVYERYRYETLTFAALTNTGRQALDIAPPQIDELDIGEDESVSCFNNGIWTGKIDDLHYAVVLSLHREPGSKPGTRIEIAVPAGAAGAGFVQRCFAELEAAVGAARCYRGKVLSLESDESYDGNSRGIKVHKLPAVGRNDVILPRATLELLDRNVLSFISSREQLRRLGQSTRKGILLYGPPGTGKTHTIRYLAHHLPGHTTLIITAAEIGALAQYMNLARLLQPALVVIEDVDLIASDRDDLGPCEESMLNALLNEMDGLKQDADILFVLTTNRPEQLEGALAGRPGRIDQAIEVPLPDEVGRGKLIELYGKGLPLGAELVAEAARRTKGVSAAFIKELMRRVAQGSIRRDGGHTVIPDDIGEALDDMLFTGGRLNLKLLGGAQAMAEA